MIAPTIRLLNTINQQYTFITIYSKISLFFDFDTLQDVKRECVPESVPQVRMCLILLGKEELPWGYESHALTG
jgi:hypothetical protein